MELSIDSRSVYPDRTGTGLRAGIAYLVLGGVVSCYFFPFELAFLPRGLNTKIMLAAVGILMFGFDSICQRAVRLNKALLPAILIAVLFSIIGHISVDINNSSDYSYANYMISFATWLLGAYAVCGILKRAHGYLNFELLVNYLIAVCVAQCFLALAIDIIIPFQAFIDTYISQDPVAELEFLKETERLYGIGAALDVAGTRFSITLIGLAGVLNQVKRREESTTLVMLYWFAFVVIALIGNMVSRTTTIGVGMALFYLFSSFNLLQQEVSLTVIKSWGMIFIVSVTLILVAIYFYHTDDNIHGLFRFAFEGFFNWIEKGEWRTDSTDRLNTVMWIWPDMNDWKTWLVGKAIFDDWHAVGTDIGYCRFVFYNGLLGLITFSLFFVYNAWMGVRKFPRYTLFFLLLFALTFFIWLKVATDLFLIYALLYCLDKEEAAV